MVVVGFATNEGTYTARSPQGLRSDHVLQPGPPGSLESYAHDAGVPRCLFDLREARKDPELDQLLRSFAKMRSIGARATESQFAPMPMLDYFDVLAWVDRTEATRPIVRTETAPKRAEPDAATPKRE